MGITTFGFKRLVSLTKPPPDSSAEDVIYHWRGGFYYMPKPRSWLFLGSKHHRAHIGEISTEVVTPRRERRGVKILYLHGGGFVGGPFLNQWLFLAALAKKTGYACSAPDYPLAPEYPYPCALNAVLDIYDHYRAHSEIILVGDSAGGTLSLALTRKLRELGKPLPLKLVTISPLVDMELKHPQIPEIETRDLMIRAAWVHRINACYAGETPLDDPYLSAINGAHHDFPPTLVAAGTDEILYPDCLEFACKLEGEGVEVEFVKGEGMFHIWPTFTWMSEGKVALDRIVRFIG